jgi:competence protein ComEA
MAHSQTPVPEPLTDRWTRSWQLTRAALADRVPVQVRARWRVPPRTAVAAAGVALALAGGVGARALLSTGQHAATIRIAPVAATAATSTTSAPRAGSLQPAPPGVPFDPAGTGVTSPTLPTGVLVVDVVGQVRHPGIVRLPAGSRVVDAVHAAGGPGPRAALDLINLARPLVDGEQLVVPRPGQQVQAAPGGAGPTTGVIPGGSGSGSPMNLNTATEADLDGLPGIGPVLAGRILAWRTEHGRFSTVDELGEVAGIGPKLLGQLRALVQVQ